MALADGDDIERALEIFEAKCTKLAALVRERNGLKARDGDLNADQLSQKVEAECRAKIEELNALQVSVR